MVATVNSCRVAAEEAETYLERFEVEFHRRLPGSAGNRGVVVLWRRNDDVAEFVLVALWNTPDDIEPLLPDGLESDFHDRRPYNVLIRGDLALAASLVEP